MAKRNNKFLLKRNILPYNYIWTKENPISYITESYQKFLVNLEYVNVDNEYKVIQVTSSVSGEGKSTFLSNVAFLLSQKGYKTVLLDLDLRKPKVHRIYSIENKVGVTEILSEKVSINQAIQKDKKYGFDVITSGEKTNAVINLLQSKKMFSLVAELKKEYDYVLVDSPPIINVSDGLYISKLADAVLFVISQEETKRGLVKEANKLLKQNDVNVIGAIMTQVDLRKNTYGYGYGYGYGYDYSYESKDDWYS